ncbi:MAG: vitamin K epoxide reductase family protein, partial [Thermomicrobiales bacterium]
MTGDEMPPSGALAPPSPVATGEGRRGASMGWRDGVAVLLGVAAVGIALYLTIVHYQHDLLVCSTGGCETVQSSKYATIGSIPIAILGLASSVTMLGAALLRIFRRDLVFPATVVIFA